MNRRGAILRWLGCILCALALLVVAIGAVFWLVLLAAPACNEPRNDRLVAAVRLGCAGIGVVHATLAFAAGRYVLHPYRRGWVGWAVLTAPGTVVPLVAAVAFRPAPVGDLFCF